MEKTIEKQIAPRNEYNLERDDLYKGLSETDIVLLIGSKPDEIYNTPNGCCYVYYIENANGRLKSNGNKSFYFLKNKLYYWSWNYDTNKSR
jgi:hypothetical protein